MNKPDFAAEIQLRLASHLPKRDIVAVVDAIRDLARDTLAAGHEFTLPSVVKISAKDLPAREIRSPRTGAMIAAPAKRTTRARAFASLVK